MGYLGREPQIGFTETVKDSFNGDNSTTAFTMSQSVSLDTDIEVFVGNVQQEPGSGKAYTVSGTTLTFSEAPPTGTGNIYVIHRNSLQGTLLPPQNLGDRNYLIGGDLSLDADSAALKFGADSDITLTHSADTGLVLKNTSTSGNSGIGAVLTLQTGDTDIAQGNTLGRIDFQAPDEGTGTDAILVAASIRARAGAAFSSSVNTTSLEFMTGASEAATRKMSVTANGNVDIFTDGASIEFGADSEIKLTHSADTGLILKNTNTGDDKPVVLTLQTGETDIAQDDVLGTINFQAPDEGTGTDAILVAAGIEAISEGDFSSSSNATSLRFLTGASETAAEKMRLTSGGQLLIGTTSSDFDDGADNLIVGSGSGDNGLTIYTGANVGDKGSIFFADGTTGSSAEKKGQISYEQNNEIMTFFTNDTLAMQIDLNGHVTMPKQSAFQARPTSQISNVTDGSSQTLAFATEIFDQNSDYNTSNYNFVAPVTGKYLLTLMLRVQSVDTASQYFQTIILTSNKEYQSIFSSNVLSSDPTYWDTIVSVVADMDKDDTAIPRVFIEGSGAAQVDIETDSYFSGCLLA